VQIHNVVNYMKRVLVANVIIALVISITPNAYAVNPNSGLRVVGV
jgi:hypothetical protein